MLVILPVLHCLQFFIGVVGGGEEQIAISLLRVNKRPYNIKIVLLQQMQGPYPEMSGAIERISNTNATSPFVWWTQSSLLKSNIGNGCVLIAITGKSLHLLYVFPVNNQMYKH